HCIQHAQETGCLCFSFTGISGGIAVICKTYLCLSADLSTHDHLCSQLEQCIFSILVCDWRKLILTNRISCQTVAAVICSGRIDYPADGKTVLHLFHIVSAVF